MLNKCVKLFCGFCVGLSLFAPLSISALESGTIYKASVVGAYYHPVTNEVLDSATSDNYSIGESMVKNIVQSAGQFEVTDSGSTYFTFRLGMMNFSNSQTFQIQTYGSSSWSTVSATVTNTGSISSGTTKDFLVKAPSTSCIVKVSMYVEPMGREVVFFVVPSNVVESDSTGMVATMVTTVQEEPTVDATPDNTLTESNQDSNSGETVVEVEDELEDQVEQQVEDSDENIDDSTDDVVEIENDEVDESDDLILTDDSGSTHLFVYGLITILLAGSGFVFYKYKKEKSSIDEEV